MVSHEDLAVRTLGPCRIDSPLAARLGERETTQHSVVEEDRILFDDTISMAGARGLPVDQLPSLEPGGPRKRIYFDPAKTRVGIVTCGGLCPGLNDVIRGLVLELSRHYGVRRIVGFRNGYRGFVPRYGEDVVDLTAEVVQHIDDEGGTILGTSRGEQDPEEVVDALERLNINILFVIGGDGTIRGAMEIVRVVGERGLKVAVVGIPKTIDNDIPYIDQSFGFQTAMAEATKSIHAASVEARSAPGGIGLVKLMGRHSGFIACYSTLAKDDADYVLIPEVPFALDGERGFLEHLRRRVVERGHAVVVVAEGAGQEHVEGEAPGTDASGNVRFGDIGRLLRRLITEHFDAHGTECNVRYFDPSYAIRSVPANPFDSAYCLRLAHAAVHAAMAGRTEVIVARRRRRFVHMPMPLAVSRRNHVDPLGDLWLSVLEATGQPVRFE
ncbi:MAG TPA: ATP-dependent 6-phosphofructokinase [Geodermatophilus sp.]|nr:ATP-dependent 6-phosphofructokinase [Geodermatophilus sp.]